MLAVTSGRPASGSSPIGRRIEIVRTVFTSGTDWTSCGAGVDEADASVNADADASVICAGASCVDQSWRLGVG